jgi:DNA-binding NarL/FixJ family response regulator/two-component sensor histidine kinase
MQTIVNQTYTKLNEVQEAMLEILDFERRRIALDLHDRVQNKLRLLRDTFIYGSPSFLALEDVLQEVRTIAYQLTPKSLQEFSLVDYLNIYETNLNLIYGEKFKTDYRTNVDFYIPKSVENQLFSIVQEGVNNVLKHAKDTPLLCIRLRKEENALVLLVQDFGKGFEKSTLDTTETIGLHSIETRANFIDARCEIEAKPNVGCKIRITVPMRLIENYKEEAASYVKATKTKVSREETPQSHPTQRILVVDNQRETADGLKLLLDEQGKTVFLAYSVADAKKILVAEKIEVLITDITMPDESGMQLVEHIRKKYKAIKCIFYSINDNPAYIFRAKNKLNIAAYIWKEETINEEDTHPLIEALRYLADETTSGAFYSAQIEKIEKTLVPHAFEPKKDGQKRTVFSDIMTALRNEMSREVSLIEKGKKLNSDGKEIKDKTTILRRIVNEKVEKEKGNHKGIDTIKESEYHHFDEYRKNLGINTEAEITHLLLKIATDFGIVD